MDNCWQLGVYTEDEEHTLPLAEYLFMRNEGRVSWEPSVEDSAIYLFAQGREWLASRWNLGNLGVMIVQFDVARERLCNGHSALIRSAVDDYADVPFLMLEPINSVEVLISLFFIDDMHIQTIYPVLGHPAQINKLYDYVAANQSQLLGSTDPCRATYSFRRLSFPFRTLVHSLKREAKLGRALYDALGEQMPGYRGRSSNRPQHTPPRLLLHGLGIG